MSENAEEFGARVLLMYAVRVETVLTSSFGCGLPMLCRERRHGCEHEYITIMGVCFSKPVLTRRQYVSKTVPARASTAQSKAPPQWKNTNQSGKFRSFEFHQYPKNEKEKCKCSPITCQSCVWLNRQDKEYAAKSPQILIFPHAFAQ